MEVHTCSAGRWEGRRALGKTDDSCRRKGINLSLNGRRTCLYVFHTVKAMWEKTQVGPFVFGLCRACEWSESHRHVPEDRRAVLTWETCIWVRAML